MQEWLSHFQKTVQGRIYDIVQLLRPDYRKAMTALSGKVKEILPKKLVNYCVLDVACGSAMATREAFKNISASKRHFIEFYGLDNDTEMLREAVSQWRGLKAINQDMSKAELTKQFDIILCSFAYHHIPDSEKLELCKKLHARCKANGNILVLEICLTGDQIKLYYSELKRQLRKSPYAEVACKFLDWTALADHSENGEWKVTIQCLKQDFKNAGWKLVSQKRLWATPALSRDAGCYLFHFRP